jgi:hypothetical protein
VITCAQINKFSVKNKRKVNGQWSMVDGQWPVIIKALSIVHCSLFIALLGCGKPLPALENINLQDWKNDKNGCTGKRMAMKDNLINQKEKLLALTETDMVKLMGKADAVELYKRSEKFYTYYFTGGPGCGQDTIPGSKMIIRFNAMNLAKEVVVE